MIRLIVASVTHVVGQMTGPGVAFSRFPEVSNAAGLFIGTGIVFLYAVLGGTKGITCTRVAQYVVLITAHTIPTVFVSLQLTSNPIPPPGLFGGHPASGEPLPGCLYEVARDLGFGAYTEQDGSPMAVLNRVLLTFTPMIGTAGPPRVVIRFSTVPRVADARRSAGWALVFIALLSPTCPGVGAMARLDVIDTICSGGVAEEPIAHDERPD